jgi:hypothetical protein
MKIRLFLILNLMVGSVLAQTESSTVVPKITTVSIEEGAVTVLHLGVGYTTSVRLPEEISSVVLGNPRWACWRFVRRMGIRSKRRQRKWSESEDQRLIKLIDLHPVKEIGRLMGRSHTSVWQRLYRLGASAAMGKDGFTKYTLASALHVAVIQIDAWINRRWLKATEVQTGHVRRVMIASADFCDFCKEHTSDAVGNRLTKERLDFVYLCAFVPSHAELLPVRESKKERIAYEAQTKEDPTAAFGPDRVDEGGDGLGRTA